MAYIRPVHDRNRPKGEPRAKPVGYEVRYRDGAGRQRTKGGFRRKLDAERFAHEVEVARQQGTLINPQQANVPFDT
ncbi:MAG: Arm DNA-binding domain-containing protein, partial [Acidimicrobiales bacterium]